jgi:hypothetical protein
MHAPRDLRPRGRSIRTPCPDQVGRKRERFRLGQVFGLVDTLRDAVSTYRCGAAPASGPDSLLYLCIRMKRYISQRDAR